MSQGRPFIPQNEQRHRLVQGPWIKYLKYLDGDEPAKIAILATFREFEEAGIPITEETAQAAVKLGRRRFNEAMKKRAEEEQQREEKFEEREVFRKLLADSPEGVVYYVRRGNAIKIGTTTNFVSRMRSLMPDEVLAVEPGSYTLEHQRHLQFDKLRYFPSRSEYFNIGDDLKDHIAGLRKKHGIPQQIVYVTDGQKLFGDTRRQS